MYNNLHSTQGLFTQLDCVCELIHGFNQIQKTNVMTNEYHLLSWKYKYNITINSDTPKKYPEKSICDTPKKKTKQNYHYHILNTLQQR